VVVHNPHILEVKTTRYFDDSWGPGGDDVMSDEVPLHYLVQTYHHHYVHGLPVVLVAYSTGQDEMRVYRIPIDQRVLEHQVGTLRAWWERHIRDGHPPVYDGSEAMGRTLAMLIPYERREKVTREASEVEVAHSAALQRTSNLIRELRGTENEIRNRLRAAIGDNYGLTHNGRQLAAWYPTSKLDEEALVRDHPEIAERCRVPGHLSRTLLVKHAPALVRKYSRQTGRTFRLYADALED